MGNFQFHNLEGNYCSMFAIALETFASTQNKLALFTTPNPSLSRISLSAELKVENLYKAQ